MLNELDEFRAYTEQPIYAAKNKRDTSYMGRFTFLTLLEFEGIGRILTTVARGYLFKDGEDPYARIEYARRALCAWCSVPEKTKKAPEPGGSPRVNFSDLSSEFPELVDAKGSGWLYRHVKNLIQFVKENPNLVSVTAAKNCDILAKGFSNAWKKKVRQLQVSIFAPSTKGAWLLRFDDILADALELGPLQNYEVNLTQETLDLLAEKTPKGVPDTLLPLLVRYYLAHLNAGNDWVILPISSVDAHFGSNSFSKKWKPLLPKDIFEYKVSYGVCKMKLEINTKGIHK